MLPLPEYFDRINKDKKAALFSSVVLVIFTFVLDLAFADPIVSLLFLVVFGFFVGCLVGITITESNTKNIALVYSEIGKNHCDQIDNLMIEIATYKEKRKEKTEDSKEVLKDSGLMENQSGIGEA